MHLYNLTLQQSSTIHQLLSGSFSNKNQVLIVRNSTLSILEELKVIATVNVFGLIRQVRVTRLAGSTKDIIVVTSDSGRIVLLEFNGSEFIKLNSQILGKSGIRRGVVGEYVAVDPMGRAILVAALERVKFGYTITLGQQVMLSSPIVSNKNVVVSCLVGLEVGYENPCFASLEQEFDGEKKVVFYELDLGLNHLVKKFEKIVDGTSHMLIAVPQGGVLVCQQGTLEFVSFDTFDTLLIDIPKRSTTADNTIIISHTTHATKKSWFMLLQTEDGDLLRMNQEMKLTYFDTVPKSNSILILKSGYLICASECGDAYIYQVESLGNDDGTIEIEPRELQHISLVDKIQSLAPLTDCVVLQGETLQILTCSGMAGQSTLRSLKHGLGVEELGNSELPAIPTGVWSVDDFLVLGFVNATLVLKVGESVEEVDGTGLVTEKQTIAVGRIGDGIVQIYEKGVRFIKDGSISEWIATGKVITGCVEDKVVVVMKTQVVVFEYLDGGIVETGSIDLESSMVSCAGTFCAIVVGQSVRMLDMKKMEMVGMQVLSDDASGLEMCEDHGVLYLHIGLVNGVYVRTTVDRVTGGLGDVRQRFLGRRVKIRKMKVNHGTKVVAMSNQTWISDEKRMVPLAYESLDMVCGLDVGIVGIVGNELRILGVEMDGVFYQSELSLKYTPRRLLEYKGKVVVLEAEYGVQGQEEGGMFGRNGVVQKEHCWGSCIRYVDPTSMETMSCFELEGNEAAISMTTCLFQNHSYETVLVVGTVTNMTIQPKSFQKGSLRVYRFAKGALQLLHVTEVDGIPQALCSFQGKILVGMGTVLRIYDIGKKKLLRKCESKSFPRNIVKIHSQGDRICVSDSSESMQFAMYRHFDNRIVIFADDPVPRWMTTSTLIDFDTVAGGDKFGTIFINRLDADISKAMSEDHTGNLAVFDRAGSQGAAHKLSVAAAFFVGETITSISKTVLVPGGREVLLYTTLLGTIGLLIPFTSKSDVEFFQLLEMTLRQETPPLSGRHHLAFRSTFCPVHNVIDGDLCEGYNRLGNEKKRLIAENLDRTIPEVEKKLDDIRTRVAF